MDWMSTAYVRTSPRPLPRHQADRQTLEPSLRLVGLQGPLTLYSKAISAQHIKALIEGEYDLYRGLREADQQVLDSGRHFCRFSGRGRRAQARTKGTVGRICCRSDRTLLSAMRGSGRVAELPHEGL